MDNIEKNSKEIEETKTRLMLVEFDLESAMKEVDEICEMAEKLRDKTSRMSRLTPKIRLKEVSAETDTSE